MRPTRRSHPRHLAGKGSPSTRAADLLADFDVAAALEPEVDFDFDELFAGDDLDDDLEPALAAPRVRAARNKIAFAVSISLAALPLLVLDNFKSAADPAPARVDAEASGDTTEVQSAPPVADRLATTEVPPVSVDVTIAKATVFVSQPSTTTTVEAPTTTTTDKPDPTTTTTKPAPATTVAQPTAAPAGPDPSSTATWDELAKCESGGNWSAVSEPRNGMQYYGGLQFSTASWEGVGGTGLPSDAPKATQIEMGKRLQARQGWDAWPTCARRLGWI